MSLIEKLQPWVSDIIKIRHQIHQNPELGFQEHQTQKLVVQLLKEYGVDSISTDFGRTGVVATIKGNLGEGKTIGLRADLDALPVTEENKIPHKSTRQGVMHACGHDGHTSMLLLATKYLASNRDFSGQAVIIFQPAEEGLGGAQTMLSDGILEKFPLDACYALHNMPGIEAGHFAFKSGPIMASSDRLFITVHGKSGHAGLPHLTRDPLLVATQIYQGIQGIISRFHNPFEPVLVSVTQIHAGETTNAIADTAHLSGTFRTLSSKTRSDLIQQLETLTEHIAKAYDMTADFKLGPISHPPTVNTENEANYAAQAAKQIVGENAVNASCEALLASEDFSYFLEKVPGSYGFIGNGRQADNSQVGLHNCKYDFNDSILPIGAAYFIQLIINNK